MIRTAVLVVLGKAGPVLSIVRSSRGARVPLPVILDDEHPHHALLPVSRLAPGHGLKHAARPVTGR